MSSSGSTLIRAGGDANGHGMLSVHSKEGTPLIQAGALSDGNGFFLGGFNKTSERVVTLYAD